MAFLGRYPFGGIVPLPFVAKAGPDGVPTEPDAAPSVVIYSDSAIVMQKFLPIVDRYSVTAFFLLPLFIGADFAAGRYRAEFNYVIGGTAYRQTAEFEVLTLGHRDGTLVGLYVMEMPYADYAVGLSSSGRVTKMRNPRSV